MYKVWFAYFQNFSDVCVGVPCVGVFYMTCNFNFDRVQLFSFSTSYYVIRLNDLGGHSSCPTETVRFLGGLSVKRFITPIQENGWRHQIQHGRIMLFEKFVKCWPDQLSCAKRWNSNFKYDLDSRGERTRTRRERTRVFVRVRSNINEHEHWFHEKYRTRTNTNTDFWWNTEHERTRTHKMKGEHWTSNEHRTPILE